MKAVAVRIGGGPLGSGLPYLVKFPETGAKLETAILEAQLAELQRVQALRAAGVAASRERPDYDRLRRIFGAADPGGLERRVAEAELAELRSRLEAKTDRRGHREAGRRAGQRRGW